MPKREALERTTVRAALTDSFITSPKEPCGDLTFARHRRDFDRQKISADFCPGKTSDLADLIALVHNAEVVAAHTKEVIQIVGIGNNLLPFGLLQKDVTNGLTADLVDLAL